MHSCPKLDSLLCAGVISSLSPDDLFFISSCLRRRGGFHVSTTPGLPVVPMLQCRTGPLRRWTGVVVRLSAVRACVAPALTRNHQIARRSTAACRFSRSARSFNRPIVSSVTDIPVKSEELDAAGLSALRGVRPSVQSLVGVRPAGGGGSMDFSNTSRVHSFGDRLLTQVRYAYSAHSLKVTRDSIQPTQSWPSRSPTMEVASCVASAHTHLLTRRRTERAAHVRHGNGAVQPGLQAGLRPIRPFRLTLRHFPAINASKCSEVLSSVMCGSCAEATNGVAAGI
jgi:hypothetical protein